MAQDYRQWDEEKLREELGRVADATSKINVAMRDGVHLSTDIYLPKDSHNALPTVFWRTPYNYNTLDDELLPYAVEAVSHGYAFVIQNERGRYFSEGEFEILGNPRTDRYDALSWIAEQDWVRNLAEDIFHPGGEDLTRRTIAAMDLQTHAAVADLGCGTGTTALMLARDFGLQVSGVDLSAANIERAIERMDTSSAAVRFIQADAQKLPFEDNELDGILAECSFSLFADQAAVLAEIKRVLKPGGKLAITDMAIGGPLPADIAEVISRWTCLVDAMDQQIYAQGFAAADFEIQVIADESASLTNLIQLLKRKLLLLGTGGVLAGDSTPTFDLATIKYWLDRFQAEVEKGSIRYLRFNLRSP